jgi:hypothetical protein
MSACVRFSDAGNDVPSTCSDGRRPKGAKDETAMGESVGAPRTHRFGRLFGRRALHQSRGRRRYAIASRSFALTRASSFSDGPDGFFHRAPIRRRV